MLFRTIALYYNVVIQFHNSFGNHLANIYFHEEDFNIKVTSYNFFATSHGKSLCDAIGGIIKRLVMRYCLRAPPEKQISTPLQMYKYVVQNCESIG